MKKLFNNKNRQVVSVFLDKRQVNYIDRQNKDSYKRRSEWIRKAIDEKISKEKALNKAAPEVSNPVENEAAAETHSE